MGEGSQEPVLASLVAFLFAVTQSGFRERGFILAYHLRAVPHGG